MKSIGATLAVSVGAFWAATAMAAKPQIQWDPDYDFSSIGTFEWAPASEATLETSDPFLHRHIANAIQYQLTSHGIAEVDSDADVRVTYYATVDRDVRLQSTSVGYGFGNYGRGGWGYWGYGIRGPVYTDTRVVEIERGVLMVDIWDASTDELIWRGKVDDITISSSPERTRRNIEKAIERMAKQADKLRRRAER